MSEDDECEVCFPWWGTVFFMVITLMFTWIIAFGITDKRWKAEAIRNGAARWVIVDEDGVTKFEWIPR